MKVETLFAGRSVVDYQVEAALPIRVKALLETMHLPIVGDCLQPHVHEGQIAWLTTEKPKPWQLVAFALKGEGQGRIKIYVDTFDRGDAHIEAFGALQPARVVVFASLKPFQLYVVAEHDLARLAPVAMLEGRSGLQDVSEGVAIEPEQWQAINEALAA